MQADIRSVSITVHLNHLRHNLAEARRLSVVNGNSSKLLATVKADAYGHGAIAVAKALTSSVDTRENADGFAVVTLAEAMEIRDAGITSPILLLQGPQRVEDFELISAADAKAIHLVCLAQSGYRHGASRCLTGASDRDIAI